MSSCPNCGFPVDPTVQTSCPKCEGAVHRQMAMGVLEVDVAHAGESWEEARLKIERALDQALHWGHKALKIVHGHGASTGRSVIAPRAIAYLRHLADQQGGRFARDRHNPGASIIWLNR